MIFLDYVDLVAKAGRRALEEYATSSSDEDSSDEDNYDENSSDDSRASTPATSSRKSSEKKISKKTPEKILKKKVKEKSSDRVKKAEKKRPIPLREVLESFARRKPPDWRNFQLKIKNFADDIFPDTNSQKKVRQLESRKLLKSQKENPQKISNSV